MERIAGSSAGTKRRFNLPKWARHEMANLEHVIAELRMGEQQLRADGRNLLARVQDAQAALRIIAGVEKIDVAIPVPQDGVTTYFILDRNRAVPIFGTQPGDTVLIARKKIL